MKIYYFTRTGRSKLIAEELAARYDIKPLEINDDIDWQGVGGYVKAAYKAVRKEALPARYVKPNEDDDIILVFPIWAGTFPPAVRTFVEKEGRSNTICIPTSGGSKLKDRDGFKKIIDLVGKNIVTPETI